MGLPDLDKGKQLALEFCQPPRQCHMLTATADGEFRGRTVTVGLAPDFTTEILTRPTSGRARQLRANPNAALVWSEGMPTLHSWAPRVVYASGRATFIESEAFLEWYERRVATRGPIRGMSAEEAAREWCVVVFTARRLRLEGFAEAGTELSMAEITRGLTIDLDRR